MNFLSELDISFNNIQYNRGTSLFDKLGSIKDLFYINVSNNEIGELGSQIFSICLEKLKRLEHINLDSNHIFETGAYHISRKLKHIPNLKVLRLNDNKIGNKGLKDLSTNLKYRRTSLRRQ